MLLYKRDTLSANRNYPLSMVKLRSSWWLLTRYFTFYSGMKSLKDVKAISNIWKLYITHNWPIKKMQAQHFFLLLPGTTLNSQHSMAKHNSVQFKVSRCLTFCTHRMNSHFADFIVILILVLAVKTKMQYNNSTPYIQCI